MERHVPVQANVAHDFPKRHEMESVSELGKLLIISPHRDDAIFACGEVLASQRGAVVVTLFTGQPSPALPLTDWDAAAGFSSTDEAIAQRYAEQGRALELLHAKPISLDFIDSQYSDLPNAIGLAEAIAAA